MLIEIVASREFFITIWLIANIRLLKSMKRSSVTLQVLGSTESFLTSQDIADEELHLVAGENRCRRASSLSFFGVSITERGCFWRRQRGFRLGRGDTRLRTRLEDNGRFQLHRHQSLFARHGDTLGAF